MDTSRWAKTASVLTTEENNELDNDEKTIAPAKQWRILVVADLVDQFHLFE